MTAVDIGMPKTRSAPAPSTGLEAALRERVEGDIRFDDGSRATYSTDSSNYRQLPLGVVVPRTVEDAVAAVALAAEHGVPVLSRGGGTSLAGQSTNAALLIDWTRYCNRLVSVDAERRTCIVEPGIALDDLNRQLADHGLMFGPRPSTHLSCTIGGMIGNNSCGATAQAYGKTADNLVQLEVLTYDGARFWAGETDDETYARIASVDDRRGQIYRALRELRDDNAEKIRERFPAIPRRVSGYNLDALLPESGFHVGRALVGSEGTLVVVLHAELHLVPVPKAKAMAVLGYADIATAGDAVPQILRHEPWQLEGLDDVLMNMEAAAGLAENVRSDMPSGGGWLLVQFAGDDQDDADRKAQALCDDVEHHEHAPHTKLIEDPATEDRFIEVREAGLGATAHPQGKPPTWEGWEDAAVPPERLGDYLRDFRDLLGDIGYDQKETALYGHFGQGCVHTRIPFELRTADGIAQYREFVERGALLVARYGGSLSGEHGDGQSKAELLPIMFGAEIVELFGRTKAIFDPENRMNPGKVVDPARLDSHLRLGTDYAHDEPRTWFSYPEDHHQFSTATLRCVGVGKCRSSESEGQVMCPSYMVTRAEEHSTRGRARLLFEMIRGESITDGWRSPAVRDALDLCFACKGCKSDCPVNVDMATYKAEFLAHHYRGRLRPAAHYSMGWLPAVAPLAAKAPRAVNAITGAPGLSGLVKRAGGIAPQRSVPKFADQRLTDWWRDRPARRGHRGRVLLWPDTFTNSFHPQIGRAAVEVLEAAGFTVEIPTQPLCCGLTWISTGQLGVARRVLRRTLRALREPIRAGVPVVGLEPSCTAVFRSDGPELLEGDEDMRRLARQTRTFPELLEERAPDWEPPAVDASAIIQTHCHQHAILKTDADDRLMKRAGVDAERLASGCCGLAGNFGFERGHYDVSMAAGERVLLPRVREASKDTVVLADGFSCRTQIEQGTDRRAVHLAELIARQLP